MRCSLEYSSRRGKLEAELTVVLSMCKLRFTPTTPSIVEKQRERIQGPFCPKEEVLLDEATSPQSYWSIVD